jgi:hypothetical protein
VEETTKLNGATRRGSGVLGRDTASMRCGLEARHEKSAPDCGLKLGAAKLPGIGDGVATAAKAALRAALREHGSSGLSGQRWRC